MPYSRWDKVRRLLWTIVWGLLARPLLRSAAGDEEFCVSCIWS